MSRTLRSFLHQATGTRAQYMHVDDIGASDLAPAGPGVLGSQRRQFNTASPGRRRLGPADEELIRSWT